jgi:hypothetical protein
MTPYFKEYPRCKRGIGDSLLTCTLRRRFTSEMKDLATRPERDGPEKDRKKMMREGNRGADFGRRMV